MKVGLKQWMLLLSMFAYKVVHDGQVKRNETGTETVGIFAVDVCM